MQFKIALCQMLVSAIKEKNISHARSLIRVAAEKDAKLVVLPEMWCCPYSMKTLRDHAEDIDAQSAPSISMLSEAASYHKITIVGGSIPEKSGEKLFNTCCVLGPDGEIKAKHRKLHLFDADLPGDQSFRESDTFAYGDGPTIVDTGTVQIQSTESSIFIFPFVIGVGPVLAHTELYQQAPSLSFCFETYI